MCTKQSCLYLYISTSRTHLAVINTLSLCVIKLFLGQISTGRGLRRSQKHALYLKNTEGNSLDLFPPASISVCFWNVTSRTVLLPKSFPRMSFTYYSLIFPNPSLTEISREFFPEEAGWRRKSCLG